MGQRFGFGIADSVLAEAAGLPQAALHLDVEAMCRAADAGAAIAERLGVPAPVPHLAGLTYVHASTLGCEVTISPDCPEPTVKPCLRRPEDIDDLAEPADYLAAGIVPQRLKLAEELRRRRPEASGHIGHNLEGPITTAALMMGQEFFLLPYDDPARAHRLIEFATRSALNYGRALAEHQGRPRRPGPAGFPDDFGGMFGPEAFGEFVVPYWEMLYQGLEATWRALHSELLREAHLPFLAELKIDEFDPSVDQYLSPETLQRSCPVPFTLRMWPSEVQSHPAEELVAMYRHRASFAPTIITFHLAHLAEEAKIAALLEVARELA